MTAVPHYLLGLDLGQKNDYTALAVLRQHDVPTGQTTRAMTDWNLYEGAVFGDVPVAELRYDVIHLARWRGKSYHDVVPMVSKVMGDLRTAGYREQLERNGYSDGAGEPEQELLVDYTGVGIAVVDSLRAAGLDCIGVTIHGGDAVTRQQDEIRVPKRELVGALQVLIQTRRIGIARGLQLAPVITAEMDNFKAKKAVLTGHDSYGAGADWRENNHDDLVLAVAMAAWYGEHGGGDTIEIRPPTGNLATYLNNQ